MDPIDEEVIAKLRQASLQGYRTLAWIFGNLYVFLAVAHAYVIGGRAGRIMSLMAAATSAALFVIHLLFRFGKVSPHRAECFGALGLGIILANCLSQLVLSQDLIQTTNLLLLLVGSAFVFISHRWFCGMVLATVASWITLVLSGRMNGNLVHFAFAIFMATLLGTAIHVIRVRKETAFERIRVLDQIRESEKGLLIAKLQEALDNIKTLHGLIPICAGCKKIRNDQGFWEQVEVYLHEHSEAKFSHGLCPDCAQKYFPGIKAKGS